MDESTEIPVKLADYIRKATIAIAIGTLRQADEPLIEVNDAFCRMTGYERDEVLGRNCRFLQSNPKANEARAKMRAFLNDEEAESGRFEVANVRKDGTPFNNLVFMSRLRDSGRNSGLIFASQFNLSGASSAEDVKDYDARLGRSLEDVSQIGQSHGLMMRQSAELISQSAAMIARIRFSG